MIMFLKFLILRKRIKKENSILNSDFCFFKKASRFFGIRSSFYIGDIAYTVLAMSPFLV